jgi:hypothetical protein
METIYFIIILILLLAFFKFAVTYKVHHDGQSVLNESKLKKTVKDVVTFDDIYRITTDLAIFTA